MHVQSFPQTLCPITEVFADNASNLGEAGIVILGGGKRITYYHSHPRDPLPHEHGKVQDCFEHCKQYMQSNPSMANELRQIAAGDAHLIQKLLMDQLHEVRPQPTAPIFNQHPAPPKNVSSHVSAPAERFPFAERGASLNPQSASIPPSRSSLGNDKMRPLYENNLKPLSTRRTLSELLYPEKPDSQPVARGSRVNVQSPTINITVVTQSFPPNKEQSASNTQSSSLIPLPPQPKVAISRPFKPVTFIPVVVPLVCHEFDSPNYDRVESGQYVACHTHGDGDGSNDPEDLKQLEREILECMEKPRSASKTIKEEIKNKHLMILNKIQNKMLGATQWLDATQGIVTTHKGPGPKRKRISRAEKLAQLEKTGNVAEPKETRGRPKTRPRPEKSEIDKVMDVFNDSQEPKKNNNDRRMSIGSLLN